MTLPYSPSRAVYQGNGAATAFPFAFKVWSTDQLGVSLTSPEGLTTPAQGWSASLGENGGTVTYLHNGAPLPAGWRLAIVRDMPFAQGIDLVSASRFDPQVIEDGLDQATAELQQLSEKITRAVILPATSEQSPEEVVQAIYASRNAAEASSQAASSQAAAAQASAQAAASSADTAAHTVQMAAENAVSAATAQASAAAASATAAAQSAAEANAASGGLAPRMDAAETKNSQQDARLTTVESNITAISTTLIGSEIACYATAGYVPLGCVPEDGAEYADTQFPGLYADYLVGGKLLTCTYAEYAAQLAQTGNCAKFALDTVNKKFRVPLKKDGDSTTQALGAAEIGKSCKAGLPDIQGTIGAVEYLSNYPTGALYATGASVTAVVSSTGTRTTANMGLKASLFNSIYGNSTTVTDEQVRLRHFVVVASAQNSASVFDWSNYMAALAGKANTDLSNATGNAISQYLYAYDSKTAGVSGGATSGATWHTRDLNTVAVNRINASLAGNRITLPAGRYYIRALVPVYAADCARAALYDYTNSASLLLSPTVHANATYLGSSHIPLEGEITLAGQTALELRMYVQTANSQGMGRAYSTGQPEKYSEIRAWKL